MHAHKNAHNQNIKSRLYNKIKKQQKYTKNIKVHTFRLVQTKQNNGDLKSGIAEDKFKFIIILTLCFPNQIMFSSLQGRRDNLFNNNYCSSISILKMKDQKEAPAINTIYISPIHSLIWSGRGFK